MNRLVALIFAVLFATPVWVTQANIKAPFDAGYTTVQKVCTPDFQAACTKLGLS